MVNCARGEREEPWDPGAEMSLLAACLLRDDLPREWISSLPQDLWLYLMRMKPPSCSAGT